MNLSKDAKVTLVQAALTSTAGNDPASDYVHMQGFDGVLFVGSLGTVGSTDVATLAAWGSTSTSSTGTAIASATQTSTAGNSDKFFAIDVYRPTTRYVKTHLTRSDVVEYGGTVAIQYNARSKPTTHGTSTAVSTGTPAALVIQQTT